MLSGDLSSETYPSGRVFSTSYNQLNQPVTLSGVFGGATANYVTGSSYFPSGALNLRGYGNTVGRVTNLNSRLQPITDSDGLNYNQYLWMDNLTWLDVNNHDNGNLQSIQIYAGGPAPQGNLTSFSQTFGYDGVNRLTSASEGNNAWSQSYGFDQYGNMWMPPTANGLPAPPVGLAAPTANVYNGNNQNGNASYDAAGNLRTFAAQNLTFDVENRLTAAGSYAYLYDGDGQRVQKVGSANGPTSYVYNAFGELAAEYTGSTWTKDYVRMGGQVIATENAATTPCKTCYFSVDHLESIRMVTDQNGSVVGRHDYAPFGQEILSGIGGRTALYGASDSTTEKFTGKERDSESGLDYFGARYYGSALGRWTSPDWSSAPEPVPYADLSNPQTLNQYSYVGNNPLAHPDADGHCGLNFACWTEVAEAAEPLVTKGQAAIGAALVGAAAVAGRYGDRIVTALENPPAMTGSHFGMAGDGGFTQIALKEKTPPNPDGQKGAPDHQAAVAEEADKARAAAQPGEQVLEGKKIQVDGSTRRPDVQTVGVDGKTKSVVEVERRPNGARNQTREAEYNNLGVQHTTRPLPPKVTPQN